MTADKKTAEFSMGEIEKTLNEIIEQRILDARREVEQLRDENVTLNLEIAELQKRVEALDRSSKRGSIIVKGLKGVPVPVTHFVRLCDNHLNEDIDVVDYIKLPSGDYILKLATVEQAENILRKRREFKGICYVNRNLTRAERTKSYNIRMLSKKLNASKTAKIRVGDFSLFVNNRPIFLYDGKPFAYNTADANMLNEILKECNVDMTCGVFSKLKDNKHGKALKPKKPANADEACCLN